MDTTNLVLLALTPFIPLGMHIVLYTEYGLTGKLYALLFLNAVLAIGPFYALYRELRER